MKKIKRWDKKSLKQFIFAYGLHMLVLIFLLNVAIYYVVHFYSIGKTCFTPAQVQADNRCLYILSQKVYQKGTRGAPHQGNACGTDVTSIIPSFHTSSPATYLDPNYVGDICTAAAPTPTPQPTSTPMPTPTAIPLPTTTPVPTNTPVPQARPTATPTLAPTNTPIPTPTKAVIVPTIAPISTPTPIVALPTALAILPTPTLSTIAQPIGPGISYAFTLPGIGPNGANEHPVNPNRQITVYLYAPSVNPDDPNSKPSYTATTQAVYNGMSETPNYGSFVLQNADLGSTVPAGNYEIAFKTDQALRTVIKEVNSSKGVIIHLEPGKVTTAATQAINALSGDLNGDNAIDIIDYNILVDCFGVKATQSTCKSSHAADINDDNVVDGIDYILMLKSIQVLISEGKIILSARVQPAIHPTIVQIAQFIKPTITPAPTHFLALKSTTVSTIEPTKITEVLEAIVTPSASKDQKTPVEALIAGSDNILLTKILSYLAFILLLGVAILGAYKSKLINALFHRSQVDKKQAAPTPPPASVVPTVPAGKKEITKIYYLSNNGNTLTDGKYAVKLTDTEGSLLGYITTIPPQDGYYTVNGYEDEVGGALTIIIISLTPASKPGVS
jgi:hypothetical protein